MTELVRFTVPGDPATKGRPRFSVGRDGNVRARTPSKTKEAERTIGMIARAAMGATPADAKHELAVDVVFRTATRQRRDIDNMLKVVLDGCNGIVWGDDFQVSRIAAEVERGSERPGFDVVVSTVRPVAGECQTCGADLRPSRRGKFCSRKCYDAAQRTGEHVPCGGCGEPVYRQRSTTSAVSYCSAECKHEAQRGAPRPAGDWTPGPYVTKSCSQCGAEVTRLKSHPSSSAVHSFCGTSCYHAFMRGSKRTTQKPCAHCGKPVGRSASIYCGRACYSAARLAA